MKGDKPTHGLVIPSTEVKRLEALADKKIKDDDEDDDPGVFVSLWPADKDKKAMVQNSQGVRVFEKHGGR